MAESTLKRPPNEEPSSRSRRPVAPRYTPPPSPDGLFYYPQKGGSPALTTSARLAEFPRALNEVLHPNERGHGWATAKFRSPSWAGVTAADAFALTDTRLLVFRRMGDPSVVLDIPYDQVTFVSVPESAAQTGSVALETASGDLTIFGLDRDLAKYVSQVLSTPR